MMWGSIANLKENLTKIALDVHDDDDYDDDEELSIYRSRNAQIPNSPYSDRRVSHRFANSSSGFDTRSPRLHGIDGGSNPEIEQYKTEIKRLRESEAEIKALSVNYAALLKEKEDQIVRLNQENGRLKQNLDATSAVLSASRNDSPRASTTSLNVVKGGEQSPKQHKLTTVKNRLTGAQSQNGVAAKHDGHSNGFAHSAGNAKELADLLEEKDKFLESMQANHESQVKNLRMELEKERERSANMQLKLQEVQRMSDSLKEELTSLKSEHNKTPAEINKLRNELDDKVSEIRRLQMELDRREGEEAGGVDILRRVIAALEKEKSNLKMEKEELEAELKASKSSSAITADALGMKHASNTDEKAAALINSPRKDELEHSLQKMERDLKDTRRERDKALQELARLKQHLLEKEAEESEKMDEDSNIIEELRQHVEHQKATILNLERALQQAYASQEEVRMTTNGELQKSREVIEDLKKKIAGYMNTIDAKNVELLNLQTALGQYYAEIEAKERLEGELSIAREECAKLSQLLKDANQEVEASKTEREVILAKLEQAERMLVEGKNRVNKLQEDNEKLRRALEQSMTRLNRMSVDSDFLVDRRIVVKLLVTYFQRNHSKEVLDLMVRMLGFSDEDKQRIGVAQHGAGKGVVRGVLGLPGRFVGGIIGGSSAGQSTNLASDNQSFADLWVDFLLKESEEREKRESVESSNVSKADSNPKPPSTPGLTSSVPDQRRSDTWRPPLSPTPSPTPLQTSRSLYPYTTPRQYEYYTGSEFSTVPLTPSNSSSRNLPLPEY